MLITSSGSLGHWNIKTYYMCKEEGSGKNNMKIQCIPFRWIFSRRINFTDGSSANVLWLNFRGLMCTSHQLSLFQMLKINYVGVIFALKHLSMKTVKIKPLENFQLYGSGQYNIICMLCILL